MQIALVFFNKLDNNSLNCLFHLYDTHIGVCNASVCCVHLCVHVSVIHTTLSQTTANMHGPLPESNAGSLPWLETIIILNKKFTIHTQVIQTIITIIFPIFIYFIRYEIYWSFFSCNLNTCAWGKIYLF